MDNGLVEFLTLLNAEEMIVYECMTKDVQVNSMAEFYSDILLKSCQDDYRNSWVKLHGKFLELKGQMDYVEVLRHIQNMLVKYLVGFGDNVEFGFSLCNKEAKDFKVKLNVDVPGDNVHLVRFQGMTDLNASLFNQESVKTKFKHMRVDFVDRVFGIMNLRFASGVIIYEVDFNDVILFWFSLTEKDKDKYPLNMFDRITMSRYYDWDYLEKIIEVESKPQHRALSPTPYRVRANNQGDDFFADF